MHIYIYIYLYIYIACIGEQILPENWSNFVSTAVNEPKVYGGHFWYIYFEGANVVSECSYSHGRRTLHCTLIIPPI